MSTKASEMKLILNEELPEDLRQELNYDASIRDLSLNDAAMRILAGHFELEWQPSGRRYREMGGSRFKLRVPEDLHRELRVQAAENLQTIRGIALHILSTHYKTTIVEPTRRARREVA